MSAEARRSDAPPPDDVVGPDVPGPDVVEESALWRAAGQDPNALAQAGVDAACAETGEDPARPVAIVFADDALLARLNAQHRGKEAPTNVLAFPAAHLPGAPAGSDAALGDVVLAFETIAAEAQEHGIPLKARALHMVVHGYLHLLGYDHQHEGEAEVMESLERRSLARLDLADPYEVADHV